MHVAIELRVVQFWSEIIRVISKSNERAAITVKFLRMHLNKPHLFQIRLNYELFNEVSRANFNTKLARKYA